MAEKIYLSTAQIKGWNNQTNWKELGLNKKKTKYSTSPMVGSQNKYDPTNPMMWVVVCILSDINVIF